MDFYADDGTYKNDGRARTLEKDPLPSGEVRFGVVAESPERAMQALRIKVHNSVALKVHFIRSPNYSSAV